MRRDACSSAGPYINCSQSLSDLQGRIGQTKADEWLQVKLGRLVCKLGKQGLVMPGELPFMSILSHDTE